MSAHSGPSCQEITLWWNLGLLVSLRQSCHGNVRSRWPGRSTIMISLLSAIQVLSTCRVRIYNNIKEYSRVSSSHHVFTGFSQVFSRIVTHTCMPTCLPSVLQRSSAGWSTLAATKPKRQRLGATPSMSGCLRPVSDPAAREWPGRGCDTCSGR